MKLGKILRTFTCEQKAAIKEAQSRGQYVATSTEDETEDRHNVSLLNSKLIVIINVNSLEFRLTMNDIILYRLPFRVLPHEQGQRLICVFVC